MTNHTPGPWKRIPNYPATVWAGADNEPKIISDRASGDAEAEANARLIAAAPDLLASVNELLAVYWGEGDGQYPEPECIQRAKAALSKVEG